MAVFTVTTTPGQDRALAYLVSKGRAPNEAAIVQAAAQQALDDLTARARERNAGDLGAAYQAAAPDVQLQVRTLLNTPGL